MGYRRLRRNRPSKKNVVQICCYKVNKGKCKASIFATCSVMEGEQGYLDPDNWTVKKAGKADHIKVSNDLEEINLNSNMSNPKGSCCNQPLVKAESYVFRNLVKVKI